MIWPTFFIVSVLIVVNEFVSDQFKNVLINRDKSYYIIVIVTIRTK